LKFNTWVGERERLARQHGDAEAVRELDVLLALREREQPVARRLRPLEELGVTLDVEVEVRVAHELLRSGRVAVGADDGGAVAGDPEELGGEAAESSTCCMLCGPVIERYLRSMV